MEAIKQSGRKSIPIIHECLSIDTFAQYAVKNWPTRLVAHYDALTRLQEITADDAGILIGPEGGLTPREFSMLNKHGFIPVSMGKTTLKTVTATIAALSILGS